MNFFFRKTPKLYLSEIETFILKKYQIFFSEEKIRNFRKKRSEIFVTGKIMELFLSDIEAFFRKKLKKISR
jgi:hypothetical protein